MFVLNYSLTRERERVGEYEPTQDKKKKRSRRKLQDDKRRGVLEEQQEQRERAVQVLCDSVYRRYDDDEENKKNMTSMYTNTHLTAKRTGKDDGTLSMMIM